MKTFLKEYWLLILFVAIGITFIFIPYYKLDGIRFLTHELRIDKYNELGDFVGGITAPFLSLVALVLLYLTYKSQKQELSQTRQILTKQTETLNKQQFETTFFNMLNLHHEIVNNIDLIKKNRTNSAYHYIRDQEIPKTTEYGRDCFRTFFDGFKNAYNKIEKTGNYKEMINKSYTIFYKLHQSDLGHYFRNLYHIFKLINKSDLKNKKDYASLVRAQLSSHELLILFYNGLSYQGEKFKELCEEFQILKNMPFDELILEQHKNLYKESAYEKTS
ncbi:MAG: putative phage abortive infection protein [Algoriphagus aquaeductus]|uniref:putative phage abortive infection protein n=1 Tax=Algoriphagus aquaeductus TaxID=475299 RepID=UPI003879084D